jgi:hypothetical protein
VISNDAFRDFVDRRGKNKEPIFEGKPLQLHSFQMLMGGFVIPSLRIRYLIDEGALRTEDIVAARNLTAAALPAAPKPPSQSKREPSGSFPPAAPEKHASPLNDLLDLSPLLLRAGDVFEAHRKRTGKAWKPRTSHKSAVEFATECFSRPVGYRDVEGRKRNDGYFFDPQYDGPEHQAVRTYLLSACPKMLPLIASSRSRLVPILNVIHHPDVAKGFSIETLSACADALDISYYERYLRSALYALAAVNGVLGEDREETDISTILKGRMCVNVDETQSDQLNFLQRGILYMLADSDNQLPDLIIAQMGWILQLPRKPRVIEAIIRGHLDWLAEVR